MQPSFSISTINPGIVVGPPVQAPLRISEINESLKPLFDIFSGAVTTLPTAIGSGSIVDVRDVATMHLWALEHSQTANGERYLGIAGYGPPQAYADILRKQYPDREDRIPKGVPGYGYEGLGAGGEVIGVGYPKGKFQISGQKARKAMGIEWISMKQSVLETAKLFENLV